MDWESLNWRSLQKLRDLYLHPERLHGDYWESDELLASYDFTFGERIGWKWAAVLAELERREWSFGGATVLDWGCGTGVASRAVIERFGAKELWVFDRSHRAMDFTAREARAKFAGLKVRRATEQDTPDLLLISHVVNELPPGDLVNLRDLIRRARAVIWVEAGTHTVSRQLSVFHDELKGEFRVVAPCTHQNACGMLAPENERHWCHSFARTPSWVFADSNWVRFGKLMGIDLRSLPYSYLALEKNPAPVGEPALTRIIGGTRDYKGYSKVLTCDGQHGVSEFILQKRDAPGLLKKLKDLKGPPYFRLQFSGDKIKAEEE